MSTAGDILTAAFKKIGIDSPSAAQTASGLISLNNLISLEGADFMVHCLTDESATLVVGTSSYTWGTGGTLLTTARPIKIEHCFLRDSEGLDHVITPLSSKDYNSNYDKDISGCPNNYYFLPEYTAAKVIFNCAPDYAYTAYFSTWKNFTEFTDTTTTVSMPNEYKAYIVYNLAISLAEDWDRVVSKTLYAMAKESKDIIARLLATQKEVPEMKFDITQRGSYDITSDTYIGS